MKAWKLFYGFISWQKQVMEDKGQNLIDFGESQVSSENANNVSSIIEPSKENKNVTPIDNQSEPIEDICPTQLGPKPGRPNKSLFEITRVEPTHGESAGDNDSEFDDTFSETHDSSSTSIVENIIRHDDSSETTNTNNTIDVVDHTHIKPLTVSVETQPVCDSTTSSASSTPPVNTTPATTVEPTSRFRIVKITKNKPYEKGKWTVNDFQDNKDTGHKDNSQKQTDANSEVPQSPFLVRRTTNLNNKQSSESSGEQKVTETNSVTSPNTTEPVKSKSSELFTAVITSRGSSYNTVIGERRQSCTQDSTTVTDSNPSPAPNVTPMVAALENALENIHSIKDSMLQSFTDEMKKLKGNIVALQAENAILKVENEEVKRLQEENETLKKKILQLEGQQRSVDKG